MKGQFVVQTMNIEISYSLPIWLGGAFAHVNTAIEVIHLIIHANSWDDAQFFEHTSVVCSICL